MSIRHIRGAYIADSARVLGEVELGRDVNVWYGAVIRGDVGPITVGEMTNVQDNVVIHCDEGIPNDIGARCTLGHGALVHGAAVGDGTLIAIGATLLAGTRIGRNCIVAAGAVVPEDLEVPDGMVVMGVPGKIVRPLTDREKEYLAFIPPHYVRLAERHVAKPDDPTVRPYI